MNKNEVRKTLREARRQASSLGDRIKDAENVRDIFFQHTSFSKDLLIASYMPTDGEVNPESLVTALFDYGYRLCLPCESKKGSPLVFRSYEPDDVLRISTWHIPEPALGSPIVAPDILLVPLVGFDRKGNRLGRGGGFYDVTLATLRRHKKIVAIGLAFDEQLCDIVPTDSTDEPLDAVVTPSAYFDCSGR